jgi:hypothetical protein
MLMIHVNAVCPVTKCVLTPRHLTLCYALCYRGIANADRACFYINEHMYYY